MLFEAYDAAEPWVGAIRWAWELGVWLRLFLRLLRVFVRLFCKEFRGLPRAFRHLGGPLEGFCGRVEGV